MKAFEGRFPGFFFTSIHRGNVLKEKRLFSNIDRILLLTVCAQRWHSNSKCLFWSVGIRIKCLLICKDNGGIKMCDRVNIQTLVVKSLLLSD